MKVISLLKDAHTRLKPNYKVIVIGILAVAIISCAISAVICVIFAKQLKDLIYGFNSIKFFDALPFIFFLSMTMGTIFLFFGQGVLAIALKAARGETTSLQTLFSRFKDWKRIILMCIVQSLLLWLWALLIIPAYIKAFSYSQSFFILLEDESIGIMDAITKSRKMMDGHKRNLFFIMLLVALILCTISMIAFVPFVGPIALIICMVSYIFPLLLTILSTFHLNVAGGDIHDAAAKA